MKRVVFGEAIRKNCRGNFELRQMFCVVWAVAVGCDIHLRK
jgi:hypothetical protein